MKTSGISVICVDYTRKSLKAFPALIVYNSGARTKKSIDVQRFLLRATALQVLRAFLTLGRANNS